MKVNVVLLPLFGTLRASLALAETHGNWTVGAAQGWAEYAVENGPEGAPPSSATPSPPQPSTGLNSPVSQP
jgi:hypothetical protein